MKVVIVYGSPTDGFTIVGPFPDHATACDVAEDYLRGENWWTVPLHTKEDLA